MRLYAEAGGYANSADLLVLLHGLGATGAVWGPLLESADTKWTGRWLALDLPGHGRSEPQSKYAIGDIAASIAQAVRPHLRTAGRLVVLGHSLGGAIGLALASGEGGLTPERVLGVGIKVAWSEEDLQRLTAIAAQPRRRFATERDAWDRYLKVSGLAGLVDAGSPVLARGIVQQGDGWCLAMDPGANEVGRPPFTELVRTARCPIHLARGRQDPLVTLDQLRSLDPAAADLGAQSHNVMVEAPPVIWDWLAAHC